MLMGRRTATASDRLGHRVGSDAFEVGKPARFRGPFDMLVSILVKRNQNTPHEADAEA